MVTNASSDPYATLGVPRSVSEKEIKSAYRKLAKELHPDRNKDNPKAAERFSKVTQAYDLLSDKDKRARFDRGEIDGDGNPSNPFAGQNPFGGGFNGGGYAGPNGGGFRPEDLRGMGGGGAEGIDLGDIFEGLFGATGGRARGGSGIPGGGFAGGGGFGGQAHRAPPQKGGDIVYRLRVAFVDAATLKPQRITLADGKTIDLKLPEGLESGSQMRLKGRGQEGAGGSGDGIVTIEVEGHKLFRRDGDDVRCDLPITLDEAVHGGKIRVPTVDGAVMMTVKPGTSGGTVLRLKGKGFTRKGGERGDQLVTLEIQLPRDLAELSRRLEGWRDDSDPRRAAGGLSVVAAVPPPEEREVPSLSPEARTRAHRRMPRGITAMSKEVLKRTFVGTYTDGFIHAGNLAYLAIFSIFPFFILGAAVFSLIGEESERAATINALLFAMPPVVGNVIEPVARDVVAARNGWLLWAGAAVALWTVSSLVETIRDILRRAYGTKMTQAFWKYRLLSFGLIIGAVVLLILSLFSQVAIGAASQMIEAYFPHLTSRLSMLQIYRVVPAIALYLSLYLLFYTLTPSKYRVRKYPKWPGVLFTTLWWVVVTAALPPVLRIFFRYNLTYGSLAGIMITLFFFWLVGFGLVVGAELNAALAETPEDERNTIGQGDDRARAERDRNREKAADSAAAGGDRRRSE